MTQKRKETVKDISFNISHQTLVKYLITVGFTKKNKQTKQNKTNKTKQI